MLLTAVGQISVVVSGLLLYRLLALRTGADGLATYGLIKQVTTFLIPAVTVGCMVSLPRYVALGRARGQQADPYLLAAMLIGGSATIVVGGICLLLPNLTAGLVLGDIDRTALVPALVATLGATSLFSLTYGYLRGSQHFTLIAGLQVLGVAASPLLVVAALPNAPVGTLIIAMATVLAVISAAVLLPSLTKALRAHSRGHSSLPLTDLVRYGSRRVPGDLADAALFAVTLVAMSHLGSITDLAFLTAGQQLLIVVRIAIFPIGLVLLPRFTNLWAKDPQRARSVAADLATFSLHLAAFATPQMLIFADLAARAWLGPDFAQAGEVIRIAVLPCALYVCYLTLRNLLDAASIAGYNSMNSCIALVAFGLSLVVTTQSGISPAYSVTWSFVIALATQGALTIVSVNRMFSLQLSQMSIPRGIGAGLLMALPAFGVRSVLDPTLASLSLVVVLELVLAVAFIMIMRPAAWTRMLTPSFVSLRTRG